MRRSTDERLRRKRRLLWSSLLILSLVAMLASAGPALAADAFNDVPSGHAYYDAIEGLYWAGAIDGYPVQSGKEFRPNNSILRAQFAKMILGVLEIPVSESDWQDSSRPFTDFDPDVQDNLYPHDYVAVAFRLGITTGKTATTFEPYVDIKRIQVISMVVRAAKASKPGAVVNPPDDWSGVLGAYYSDPSHGQNVRIAEYNGLLDGLLGFGSNWNADAKATRGEAAQIMWNLYTAEDFGLLFYDDFSDPKSGWTLVAANENYKCGYQPAEQWYSIDIFVPNWRAAAWLSKTSFDDFALEARAGCVVAETPGEYGLLFRMQDGDNYYCFSLTNEGYWQLRKLVSDAWQVILAPAYSDVIYTGDYWNYLGVECLGSSITLYINDVEVGRVSDSTFSSGWIGLMGRSFDVGGIQTVYDDVYVWSLTDEPPVVEEEFFRVGSLGVAYNGATSPTMFTVSDAWQVTELGTYHWNNGQGVSPGTISLRGSDGTVYGPWQATGLPGQGGVPNANWVVYPDIMILPGTYTVIDSSNSTWSQNSETGGRGMAWGKGILQIPI
jgi:hypothetical protein